MIVVMLRGFFLIGIISWYSFGVFKMINEYFRSEYKSYLTVELERNTNLLPNSEDNNVPKSLNLPKSVEIEISSTKTTVTKDSLSSSECIDANYCINRQELNPIDNEESEKIHHDDDRSSANDNDDESKILNYWLNRKQSNYDDAKNDAHCHVENVKKM